MAGVESDWVRHLAEEVRGLPVVGSGVDYEVYVHPEMPFGWSVLRYFVTRAETRIVIGRDTWLTLGYDSRSQWAFFNLVRTLPAGAHQHDAVEGPLADAVKAKAMLEPARQMAVGGADRVAVLKQQAHSLLTQATSLNDRSADSRQWKIFATSLARMNEEVAELEGDMSELRALLDSVAEAYV